MSFAGKARRCWAFSGPAGAGETVGIGFNGGPKETTKKLATESRAIRLCLPVFTARFKGTLQRGEVANRLGAT
jgi:hypothetical protein